MKRPLAQACISCSRHSSLGFTLIELMVVITIMAIATAAVVLTLRGGSADALELEALRLAAMLDGAHSKARATGQTVVWRAVPGGFVFSDAVDASGQSVLMKWQSEGTRVAASSNGAAGIQTAVITLAPEAILPPQQIELENDTEKRMVSSDGLRPFAVTGATGASGASGAAGSPQSPPAKGQP